MSKKEILSQKQCSQMLIQWRAQKCVYEFLINIEERGLLLKWQGKVLENNMKIIVCMYMSAEVKYMWKLEFPSSKVNFHWIVHVIG